MNSPFQYEKWLSPTEFQKLGELTLKWSHLDHIIGNCLAAMLRLSAKRVVIMVFPLTTHDRLEKIKALAKTKRLNEDAVAALNALNGVMNYILQVRRNIIHAIMIEDDQDGPVFHLRSKKRTLTKEQAFSIEELTNYAAHAAFSLLHAVSPRGHRVRPHPLPDKPDVPDFLTSPPPSGIRVGPPLLPRQ